jgi:hypothetical protein
MEPVILEDLNPAQQNKKQKNTEPMQSLSKFGLTMTHS